MSDDKRATMASIARLAGVSSMTVSRAFKRDARIHPDTRETILRIADELGYVVDTTAASFRLGQNDFVAVTLPSLNNANFADTVEGLSRVLVTRDLQLLLGHTNYQAETEERLIEQMLGCQPRALVVTGGPHSERCRRLLRNARVPVIEIWDVPADPLGFHVGFSNAQALEQLVDHAVAAGYRRLAFIGGEDERDSRGVERRQGFRRALARHGLESHRLIPAGAPPIAMAEGARALALLLETWPDADLVMCVSDLCAFGALSECQRRGIAVPEHLALAGFGNYEIGRLCVPALTTVDTQARLIGERTGRLILDLLDGAPAVASVVLEPRLLARASSR